VRSFNVRRADIQVAHVRSADLQVGEDRATLSISSPLAGALYLIDPTLRPEFQRLPLRARGAATGPLEWFVDDAPIGRAHRDEPMWWPLAKGTHTIAVRDAGGRSASTHIVVR
jgi:membrane carboxypeptidase/penicillin-binding protein PbpC